MRPLPPIGFVLLGTLFKGPAHGYGMLGFMSDHFSNIWHISNSQMYALLKRLEKEGYISATIEIQNTRPLKKVFSLTKNGKKAFVYWLHAPVTHAREFRLQFLTQLFFLHHFQISGGETLIKAQIKHLEKTKLAVRTKKEKADDAFKRFVFEFKENRIGHLIGWLFDYAMPFFTKKSGKKK